MSGRGMAGIMEKVTLVTGADSVQDGQGVAVWLGVLICGAGVAGSEGAGQGRRWGREWAFPR